MGTYQVGNFVRYFPRADMIAVLGTSQDATEHFNHHSQTVAFVPSWGQQHRHHNTNKRQFCQEARGQKEQMLFIRW